MSSLFVRLVRWVLRLVLKKEISEPEEAVRHFRKALGRTPGLGKLPPGVSVRPIEPGELGDVQGEWVGVPAARRTILHHHGGAYVSGDPASYRNLGAHLARPLLANMLLARYRLAPEHPYPAALDDALSNYRALIERVEPATLAVSGDSAGGGLTLALLQRVRDEGLPLPAAAVLLSPWADLTDEAPSRRANATRDDMLTPSALAASARAYLGDTDPREPGA
ncbi:MAG: alpha/beta hydrolase fold domain-containing protein, partial [Myxococcota bacterium]